MDSSIGVFVYNPYIYTPDSKTRYSLYDIYRGDIVEIRIKNSVETENQIKLITIHLHALKQDNLVITSMLVLLGYNFSGNRKYFLIERKKSCLG